MATLQAMRACALRLRCPCERLGSSSATCLLTLAGWGSPCSWTIEQRLQHRIACKSKGKLSLGQKLDIITQHQSRDPVTRKTQVSTRALAC